MDGREHVVKANEKGLWDCCNCCMGGPDGDALICEFGFLGIDAHDEVCGVCATAYALSLKPREDRLTPLTDWINYLNACDVALIAP